MNDTTPLLLILTVAEVKQLLIPSEIEVLLERRSITVPSQSLLDQARIAAMSPEIRDALLGVAQETEPTRPPADSGATAPPGT